MTKFSPPEFQCLLRWRLGIPFASPSRFCNGCGSLQDPLGDHALSCHALGLYTRHNFLRDELVSQLHKVGLNAYPNGYFPGNPGDHPADILVADAFDAGQPVALDISIVHPLMPSRVITTIAPGDTAARREAEKVARYGACCRNVGWGFMPVVCETTGAWGKQAQGFISKLAHFGSMHCGDSVSSVSAQGGMSYQLYWLRP